MDNPLQLSLLLKVIYMNEHKEDAAKKLSDKIEKATRFKLYNDNLDSENYQIMNYGIGGTISGHVDSSGMLKPAKRVTDLD